MSFVTAAGGRGIAGRTFGPIISLPAVQHSATVIMLHGLVRMWISVVYKNVLGNRKLMTGFDLMQGDTGNGWAPVAPELNLSHIKWCVLGGSCLSIDYS